MSDDDRASRGPEWLGTCRPFIDSIDEQMMVISEEYQILMVNRAFLERTGLDADQVIGRRCHAVTHHSDQPCWANGEACPLQRVIETGRSTAVSHVHYDGQGKPRHVEIVGSAARDAVGRVVGVIESMRDVTEEKELREALMRRNAELEEARRRREQHTSAVCHELGNVINNLSLHARVLGGAGKSPEAQRHSKFILEESVRLGRLVEDMRDAAAIESGRFSIRPASCDLADLVRRAAAENQVSAGDRNLVVEAGEDAVAGTWDAVRLRQVMDNLISNAIKFSSPDTEVRISLTRSHARAAVSVVDRGSGIPADSMAELFKPYARAHARVPGVGLGLFLCRGIIEAHGGEIAAVSVEGKGTTMTFWLPIGTQGTGGGR